MYKVTIEEILGEVKRVTTVETDDVDLVKTLLEIKENVSVHSDVDNLNIDPEWQELMKWYREQKAKEKGPDTPDETIAKFVRIWEEAERKSRPTTPFTPAQPYVNPFSKPYDPYNPFIITC